jgi:hypothetical protein
LEAKKQQRQSGLEVPSEFSEFAQLCRIRSGTKIIPFELFPWQQELSFIADKYSCVTLKCRQTGATELFAAKMLHRACLSSAYAGAVLSMGGKETSKVAKRVRRMPSQVPGFRFAGNAVTQLEVAGGGSISFMPSTDNAVRSIESVHDLLFDEAGFVPNIEEIYSSATPAQEMVGSDARTWVVSTIPPSGKLCWFWELFDGANGDVDVDRAIARAQEGLEPFQWWLDENGWAKVIVHWKAHPIYSQIPDYLGKIKREKKLTEEKLQREYNLGLPELGGLLFQSNLIEKLAVGQWKKPIAKHKYLAGIDPNFGGDDYFVLLVWDVTQKPFELVKQFRANNTSSTYNQAMVKVILNQYQPIITAVEKNSGGTIVLENLARDCPSLRFESVVTSAVSKKINTDRLALALEAQDVVYPPDWEGCAKHKDDSGNLVDGEMYRFSASERRATKGHDDTILAWSVAFAFLDEVLKG